MRATPGFICAVAVAAAGVGCQLMLALDGPARDGDDGGPTGSSTTDAAVDAGGVVAEGGGVAPGSYAADVMADEPFVYWSFDEATGPLLDRVNGRALLVDGDVVREPGVVGGAVRFQSPTHSQLTFGDSDGTFDLDHDEEFTIELWLKPNAASKGVNTFLNRRKQVDSNPVNGFIAYLRSADAGVPATDARFELWREKTAS